MNMNQRLSLGASALMLALAVTAPSFAQQPPPPPAQTKPATDKPVVQPQPKVIQQQPGGQATGQKPGDKTPAPTAVKKASTGANCGTRKDEKACGAEPRCTWAPGAVDAKTKKQGPGSCRSVCNYTHKDEKSCTADQRCTWVPERVNAKTKAKTAAFCRLKTAPPQQGAAKGQGAAAGGAAKGTTGQQGAGGGAAKGQNPAPRAVPPPPAPTGAPTK